MFKYIICLLFCFSMFTGCATIKIEHKGLPVANNIVRASILSGNIEMSSALIRYYGKIEGDEVLLTYEYIKLRSKEKHLISSYNLKGLCYKVQVFNPRKVEYQMFVERYYYDETKRKRITYEFKSIYAGNLSMKDFNISLPLDKGSNGYVQLFVHDEDGLIIYQSPKAGYEIGEIKRSRITGGYKSK